MATWTNPATPVSLTAITTAFYNVNVRDNLNWARAMLGGTDPGAAGKILVSDTSSSMAFLAAGADGTVLSIVSGTPAYVSLTASFATKVNLAGDTMTGALGVPSLSAGTTIAAGTTVSAAAGFTTPAGLTASGAISGASASFAGAISGASVAATAGVSGASGSFSGAMTSASAAVSGTMNAGTLQQGGVGAVLTNDARLVPAGAVVMFRTAAEIASGWTQETNLDGRIPVGAGSTFSQTFVENTAYGSSWTPAVSVGVNNGTLAASAGTVAAPNAGAGAVASGAGATAGSSTHTHPGPTISLSGVVALSGTSTAWLPAMRAYVFARKN